MSSCPSLTLSCDNNHWNCCGSAKDPEHHGDASSAKQQPAPQHPPPTQPPPGVVAPPPPSDSAPPHHVSPVAPPHSNKAHDEPPQPAWTAVTPRDKPPVTPTPAMVSSSRYEPPQPAWSTVTPRAPVPPNEPPGQTAWPPHVPPKTCDDGGVPAVTTMRPPLPHRMYPAPAVAPAQPAASTPRAGASQYPPAHHPHHDNTDSQVESHSQAHLQEY
jgi:hypothetical protein